MGGGGTLLPPGGASPLPGGAAAVVHILLQMGLAGLWGVPAVPASCKQGWRCRCGGNCCNEGESCLCKQHAHAAPGRTYPYPCSLYIGAAAGLHAR